MGLKLANKLVSPNSKMFGNQTATRKPHYFTNRPASVRRARVPAGTTERKMPGGVLRIRLPDAPERGPPANLHDQNIEHWNTHVRKRLQFNLPDAAKQNRQILQERARPGIFPKSCENIVSISDVPLQTRCCGSLWGQKMAFCQDMKQPIACRP